MGALSKILIASFFLGMVAGCGSGGGGPAAPVLSYKYVPEAGMAFYYNDSPNPMTIEVAGSTTATPVNTAKVAAMLAAGDTYQPLAPAASVTIAGCSDTVEGSQVRVCWVPGWEGAGQYLLGYMPMLLAKVRTFGDPGEVDVVLGGAQGYAYAGEYQSDKKAVYVDSTPAGDGWTYGTAVHELTHAAFYKATGSDGPSWINEGMATMMEATRYHGSFDGGSITAYPATYEGYSRVHAVANYIKLFNPDLSAEDVRVALKSGDVFKSLTDLDTPTFSKMFWNYYKFNQPTTPPGRHVVPPYTAVKITAETMSSAPLELLWPIPLTTTTTTSP